MQGMRRGKRAEEGRARKPHAERSASEHRTGEDVAKRTLPERVARLACMRQGMGLRTRARGDESAGEQPAPRGERICAPVGAPGQGERMAVMDSAMPARCRYALFLGV